MVSTALAGTVLSVLLAAAGPEVKLDPDVICVVNGEPVRVRDLERAVFLDDYGFVKEKVIPFLVLEKAVRQEMSGKGVTVGSADLDRYMHEMDRQLRAHEGQGLDQYLKAAGMEKAFFRRQLETTLGLYRLAGGTGGSLADLSAPEVKQKMNNLGRQLTTAAEVKTELKDLPEGVAALVNGEKITVEEAGRVARMISSRELKQRRLAQLQRYVLVRQELERRKLGFGEADLDYQVKLASSARATKIGEVEFPMEQILEKLGRDMFLLRRQYGFRRVAMLSKMVKDQVAEKDLEAFFEKDPALFGEGVPRASQVMVSLLDSGGRPLSARDREKAKDLAESVYKRALAGEDFGALAAAHSDDKETAKKGGDMGYLDPSKREKDPVIRMAYDLKKGEICRPVFSRRGWHVVKVTDVLRARFDEVRPLVLAAAIRQLRRSLEEQLLAGATVVAGPAAF